MTHTTTADVRADQTDAPIGAIQSDIVYAVHDGMELPGDFYRPAGEGPFPVVIAAPGGGWAVSDPRGIRAWGIHLARRGIAVFAIRYRSAVAEKTFPGAVCDVLAAIQFVRGSAATFDIDPERIGLLGSSAGAHVTALAALAGHSSLFKDRQPVGGHAVSTGVKLFAGIYGVYDLFAHWQNEIADFPNASARRSECFLGTSPYMDRQLYFDASPISHVRHAANRLAVFLSYGTADHVVRPQSQSEAFLRTLKQAGFAVCDCPVVGAGHFWFSEEPIEEPGSYAGFLAPRLLRFLQRHL